MVEMEGSIFCGKIFIKFSTLMALFVCLFVCFNCCRVQLFRGGDTVDLEKSARAIQVSDRMKGAMYFT